ncbi:MAG: VCBS repeat-containing protein [Thermoguttaceae bacterium]|jgi:hypothetical protein
MTNHCRRAAFLAATACVLLLPGRPAWGYVEAAYSLGRMIGESTNILVARVESVDQQKNTIVYRKVQDVKGVHRGETIKNMIGHQGYNPREWKNVMAWAEVGKTALIFHNGSAAETCIEGYWYQTYAGDWWSMSHAEPFLLRTYCGKPERLAAFVAAMLAGQEVVIPCMGDSDKNACHLRNGKVIRMKASLKIQDHNPKRDFVEGGADEAESRLIAGMPGFTNYISLGRLGIDALGAVPGDLMGNGKTGLCLFGAGRMFVLQAAGNSFEEVVVPFMGGARAAAWADFDGDGKLDLLLATPAGPRLFRNTGKQFEDVSACLPAQGYCHLTAAVWIDYDGDGRPDILLADAYRGLRLFRNKLARGEPQPKPLEKPNLGPWYYAGPFDNTSGQGFDTAYPPEKEVDLQAEYVGKNNEKVAWREGRFRDGQVNGLSLSRQTNTDCVAYLYRELDYGGAVDLPVSLGSNDTLAVWLNGVRVHAENCCRTCQPGQVQLTLRLRPGKNKLLLKVCQGGYELAFYYAARTPTAPVALAFEDVSDQVGLGSEGIAGKLRGDHLAVVDVNGDGRPGFLFSAGTGVLVLNTPQGFVEAVDCGIAYTPGGVTPVFGDFLSDGRPGLLVPQRAGCKLFRNDGKGRFTDVTAESGDLARPLADARSAAWADFRRTGRLDLFVGCMKGPNRYFRNNGKGKFADASDEIGLTQRIFNTRSVTVVDLNNDKVPDVVFCNEGQDVAALLANPNWPPPMPAATGMARLSRP